MTPRKPTTQQSLHAEEIEAHRLLTQSMNMLSDRIERTETDFIGHLKKVEDRLDQIVDLTKTVAVLQQQSTQQSDQIVEVRTQLRDYSQKFDNSISRIHTRLDEISNHQRDKLEFYAKETDLHIKEVKNNTDLAVKEVKTTAERTEKEFKQWLNRGWGAWAVLILIIGTVNTMLWRYQDKSEREQVQITQTVEKLKADTALMDQKVTDTIIISKDAQQAIKRNEQQVRDLEDLMIRKTQK